MTTLLVASSGGHLQQLRRLRPRLPLLDEETVWVTYDGPQARSLLADEDATFVPYIGARDPRGVLAAAPAARRLLRQRQVSEIISTGSQIALTYAPSSVPARIPFHFIESAARSVGPSLTGRLIRHLPSVTYYTQYQRNAGPGACYGGWVFEGYSAGAGVVERPLRRVVVSLGTFRGYGFRRLVDRVRAILPPEVEVLWQTGDTDVSDLPIKAHREIPSDDLSAAIREADAVISHAGVGTALACLEVGRVPVLVPRRAQRGEHVDDHQTQIADGLAGVGLALTVDADDLSLEVLERASRQLVVDDGGPTFGLVRRPPR